MRFKSLKSFTLGKLKDKPEEETDDANGNTAAQIAEMEEQINHRTKGLEETAQQLQELSDKSNNNLEEDEDTPPRPHGPLSELSIEPEDKLLDIDLDTGIDLDSPLEEDAEELKVVELSAGAMAPAEGEAKVVEATAGAIAPAEGEAKAVELNAEAAAPAEEQETKSEDEGDSLKNLFSDEEEEENPLANLIKSLPEVTAQELLDDLQEIKEIIQEWQPK